MGWLGRWRNRDPTSSGDLSPLGRRAPALESARPRETAGADAVTRLLDAGEAGRAAELAERLLAERPEEVPLHVAGGQAYMAANDAESALDLFSLALHYAPTDEGAYVGVLRALERLGRDDEAEAVHAEFLARVPGSAAGLYNHAHWLYRRGRFEDTIARLEELLARHPRSAAGYNFLGFLKARQLAQLDEGERLLRRAFELDPQSSGVLCNLGWALVEQRRAAEGLRLMAQGVARNPDDAQAAILRAEALLKVGRFAEGWEAYEARWKVQLAVARPFVHPQWDGGSAPNARLLVYAEQGLGDQIMFLSCLPDALARVASCVVECEPRLASLVRRSFPGVDVVPGRVRDRDPVWPATVDPPHVQVAMGSLPRFFRRQANDFPTHSGYLRAAPARVARWRERLTALGPRPWVGLSWRGGLLKTRRDLRSIPLAALSEALRPATATLVSLQYGEWGEEIAACAAAGAPVHRFEESERDYDETAALVCALDCVVSVCTAVVHLAGALGARALVLVPYTAEWRYGAEGERMLWYPSVRLFRQPRPLDWRPVFEDLVAAVGHAA